MVQVLTGASVPSTLIKCLYLFFDLPEHEDKKEAESSTKVTGSTSLDLDAQFTSREKELLLQKIFIQVITIQLFIVISDLIHPNWTSLDIKGRFRKVLDYSITNLENYHYEALRNLFIIQKWRIQVRKPWCSGTHIEEFILLNGWHCTDRVKEDVKS